MPVVKILSVRLAECSEIRLGRFMIEMAPFSKMLWQKFYVLAFSWYFKRFMLKFPIM